MNKMNFYMNYVKSIKKEGEYLTLYCMLSKFRVVISIGSLYKIPTLLPPFSGASEPVSLVRPWPDHFW